MSADWKGLLAKVAPVAASFLGGPLAGAVTQQVSSALLGKSDGSSAELAAALGAPDAVVKLREIEVALEAERNRHREAIVQADNADRANARDREIQTRDSTPRQLAFLVTGIFFIALMTLFYAPIPPESRDIAQLLVGQLGTVWIMVMTYYYGTTSRSAATGDFLMRAATK